MRVEALALSICRRHRTAEQLDGGGGSNDGGRVVHPLVLLFNLFDDAPPGALVL